MRETAQMRCLFAWWQIALIASLLASLTGAVQSADINVTRNSQDNLTIITVIGTIEYGDDVALRAAMAGVTGGVVLFDSLGGNLDAGIEMGKAIRFRQLATAVTSDSMCFSACALAWLGGTTRMVQERGYVGFHAAYTDEGGATREAGGGNARAGAYVGMLGFSDRAAEVLMTKGPNDMLVLTPEIAEALKIDVVFLPEATVPQPDSQAAVEPQRASRTSSAEEDALALVRANLEAAMQQTPDGYGRFVEANYAETVSYHGEPTARATLAAGARRYKERWPELSYTVATQPKVRCANSVCDVWGEGEFDAKSGERNAHSRGTFRFFYQVGKLGGRSVITAESSEVQRREAAPLNKTGSLAERLQLGLQILGCNPGPIDGIWGPSSEAAMKRFNAANARSFPSHAPSAGALQAMTGPQISACAGGKFGGRLRLPWQ